MIVMVMIIVVIMDVVGYIFASQGLYVEPACWNSPAPLTVSRLAAPGGDSQPSHRHYTLRGLKQRCSIWAEHAEGRFTVEGSLDSCWSMVCSRCERRVSKPVEKFHQEV